MARTFEMNFRLGAQLAKDFRQTFSGAQGAMSNVQKHLAGLAREANNVDGLLKHKNQLALTAREHLQAKKRVDELARAMQQGGKPTREMIREMQRAKQAVERTGTALERERAQVQSLSAQMGVASKSTRELEARQRALAAQADKARKAQGALQGAMAARDANKARQADLRGQMLGTAAMAAVFAAPVKVAADFQQQLATVGAKGGYSAADMKALREQARELGASTVWSATEAAQGMEYLAMAGFKASESMAAMPGLLDLASAAGSDLGVTADIASDILSGFGIEAKEMGRVADVLAKTTTTSNTNLEMLGDTMKYVAPVARTAGMSLEEASAMAGLLANVGIKSSQAGTTMKSMLLRLANPSGKAADILKELGVAVADSDGNMRNMVEVMADMAKATEKMGSQQRLEAIGEVFGREPAAGMAELIEKGGAGAIQAYVGIMNEAEGTASKIAKDMNDTFYGSMKQMKSAGEDLMITMGDALIPTLREFTDYLTKITAAVGNWTKENPELTDTIVKAAAALVALKVATLAGTYAFTVAKGVMLTANVAMKALRVSTLLFNAALWASPITWIVAGIALVAGGAYLLWKNWDWVTEKWNKLWSGIKQTVSNVWGGVKEYFANFSLFESGKKIFQTMIDGLKSMGGKLVDTVSGAFGKVRDLMPFSDAKEGPFSDLTQSGRAIMETLGAGVQQAGANPILKPFSSAAQLMMDKGSALASRVGAGVGALTGASGGSVVNLHLTQNINVGGGAAEVRAQAAEGGKVGAAHLLKMLEDAMEDDRRLSFG